MGSVSPVFCSNILWIIILSWMGNEHKSFSMTADRILRTRLLTSKYTFQKKKFKGTPLKQSISSGQLTFRNIDLANQDLEGRRGTLINFSCFSVNEIKGQQ